MRKSPIQTALFGACLAVLVLAGRTATTLARSAQPPAPAAEVGRFGGRLVIALRSEPKTLNPVVAVDAASKEVIGCLMADLIHIDRSTHATGPALAESWTKSRDGRRYVLKLRSGLAFSDGHPMDADDVVFSFQVYSDEKVQSPQRGLLVIGGHPIEAKKIDARSVAFEMVEPYAAAERLFDGFAVLPRHLLEKPYREGRLSDIWGPATSPGEIAGLGPYRVKEYIAGQRLTLERNPRYWKTDRLGNRLPYLDEIVFLFVPTEDAQVIRFEAGDTDAISRVGAENFGVLERQQTARSYRMRDLGPGLEYALLFFNLNDLPAAGPAPIIRRQEWFRQVAFRQAISAAIDRDAVVRLAFQERAAPLWGHVTPGNRLWINRSIPTPPRSLDRARRLLASSGFVLRPDGTLADAKGAAVEFSIATNAANAQRVKIATLLQEDLRQIGIKIQVAALENRALLSRVLKSFDYEACLLALGSGDADPNGEMNIWPTGGATHLWHLGEGQPATAWEAEIDRLMRQQLVTLDPGQRKKLYDRVQQLVAENLPVIPLAAPHMLVGAKERLGNFRPAVLDPYVLWNVEELFWRDKGSPRR